MTQDWPLVRFVGEADICHRHARQRAEDVQKAANQQIPPVP
jgi:hypothetical protein